MVDSRFPPARAHGEITEPFPDVFVVTGAIRMAPLLRFSRNMVIVREGERLVLIGSMRLDEAGLEALDALGEVTDVIRLAGFHGVDDPFYKDRYGAKIWVVEGATYQRGFDAAKAPKEPYFTADAEMTPSTELPLADAELYTFSTTPPEGMLLLKREGGILVSGDCLQNWYRTDEYFSLAAKLMMKAMGFIKPHNIGPGWVDSTKPAKNEVHGLLDLAFEHVLPVHGAPVIGGAKDKYRGVIETYPAK